MYSASLPGVADGQERLFVAVGGFGPGGLNVNNNNDDNDNVGVSCVRKFCAFLPLSILECSAGDGL